MSKNIIGTKNVRIMSFILTLAMLIASLPMAYAENNSDYMLYRAEFDSASDPEISDFWGYISESDKFAVTSSKWQDGGYITEYSNSNHYRFLLDKDYSANITTDSVIVWEARIKHSKNQGGVNADGNINSNFNIFSAGTADENNGLRIYGKDGYFAYSAVNGVKPSGKMTDYRLKADTFYTYKIKYIPQTKKAKFMVSNEEQGLYESDWVSCGSMGTITYHYATFCGSLYYYKTTADYLRIYDEAKLPKASIAESDLTNLKNGDTLTVNLGEAITEDILAENPITVDGGASVSSVLSADGKTITVTLSGLKERTVYTLTVPKLGENLGLIQKLKSADADYMLYRAEFDTAQDIEISDFWGYISETDKYEINSSSWKDGGYISAQSNSNHYNLLLDKDFSKNITDNSVIIWETTAKYEKNFGGTSDVDGTIALASSYTLFSAGGSNGNNGFRIFGNSGYFAYSVMQGVKPSEKMTDYMLKTGEFYTFKIKWDKANGLVKFSVSNKTQGFYETAWLSTAASGDINLKNAALCGSLYYYKVTADYLRIYDESLIPEPKVTDGSVDFINDGIIITFPFEVTEAELSANPITISDEALLTQTLSADKMSVTVTANNTELKKVYKLTVPSLGGNKSVSFDVRQLIRYLGNDIADIDNLRTDSEIILNFSEELSENADFDSLIDIIDENGEKVKTSISLNGAKKALTVAFPKGLRYSRGYTADFKKLFESELIGADEDSFKFKTEAYPVYVKNINCSLTPLKITFFGANNSGAEKTIKAIIVYYGGNGMMIGCEIKDIALENGEKQYTVDSLISPEGTKTVSCCLFEDIAYAVPVFAVQ